LSERSPGGLADFALLGLQPQSGQAINRNSGQHAVDCPPVPNKSVLRRWVRSSATRRDAPWTTHAPRTRQILYGNTVVAAVESHHRKLGPIGGHPGPRIVVAAEGDPLRPVTRVDTYPVDLRPAGTIRGEKQRFSVRGPRGFRVDGRSSVIRERACVCSSST